MVLALHKNWDSTTWRYTPHPLKGIRPVTKEPWARDEVVYNGSRNSVDRDGVSKFFMGSSSSSEGKQGGAWDSSVEALPGRAYPQ